jgi:alginate O-acetyltransferase complex protein AlgI
MAIGIAKIFGYDFPENFNFPYISRSIQEFWQRWHMSLSSWLRDYLFVPLSIRSRSMGKAGIALSLLITFFVCGLWHGPSWTFVLWGLLQGVFLAIESIGFRKLLKRSWAPLNHLYVMIIVIAGWVLFRSETFEYARGYFNAMLGNGTGISKYAVVSIYMNTEFFLCLAIAIVGSTRFFPLIGKLYTSLLAKLPLRIGNVLNSVVLGFEMLGILLIMVCATMYLITSSYNPFIYFRF